MVSDRFEEEPVAGLTYFSNSLSLTSSQRGVKEPFCNFTLSVRAGRREQCWQLWAVRQWWGSWGPPALL